MEYVEVTGRSVDLAIDAALAELGIESREHANIEVLEEGAKGFLGIGGKDAVVKVSRKPKRRRRRRRSGKGDEGEDDREQSSPRQGRQPQGGQSGGGRSRGDNRPRQGGAQPKKERGPGVDERGDDAQDNVEEQAQMVEGFLKGLIGALGLEGEVSSRVEDGIIKAEVKGDQTEVLVGPKGSMIRTVQELARTVIQRRTPRPRRVIIDIAGYGARRREALAIYAQRLAESILLEGGEIMLEPMNAADRKVVHDTIAEVTNVRSYSEGEEPRRCVVIATVEGYQPPAIVEEDFVEERAGDDEE